MRDGEIREQLRRLWDDVRALNSEAKATKKVLEVHKLYKSNPFSSAVSNVESIHHNEIKNRLDKLENDCREIRGNCTNSGCPHHNKEALTHCECDPFECKKYKNKET